VPRREPPPPDAVDIDPVDDWPPKVLELVGAIVIAFGQLEYLVWLAAKRRSGIRLVTYYAEHRDIRFGTYAKVIRKQHGGDTKLNALIEEASKAANKRHDVVHALWGRRTDTGRLVRWRYRRNYGIQVSDLKRTLSRLRRFGIGSIDI
jgi:hypothetical protein